jgi:hypothetical protein
MSFDIEVEKNREGDNTCYQKAEIEILHGSQKLVDWFNNRKGGTPDECIDSEG